MDTGRPSVCRFDECFRVGVGHGHQHRASVLNGIRAAQAELKGGSDGLVGGRAAATATKPSNAARGAE